MGDLILSLPAIKSLKDNNNIEIDLVSSEQNYIYVGMARETAHQLGTPISSLMGWLKLLENKNENVKEIYSAMQKDVDKLNNISHKFNKIGSKPKFKKIELIIILEEGFPSEKTKLVAFFFNSQFLIELILSLSNESWSSLPFEFIIEFLLISFSYLFKDLLSYTSLLLINL